MSSIIIVSCIILILFCHEMERRIWRKQELYLKSSKFHHAAVQLLKATIQLKDLNRNEAAEIVQHLATEQSHTAREFDETHNISLE